MTSLIDDLRQTGATPAYFGLGFIQLKTSDTERFHFYHHKLPVLAEEPHSHRYDFISMVLQGNLIQTLYSTTEDPSSEYSIYFEDCKSGMATAPKPIGVNTTQIFQINQPAGSIYTISADVFHTVKAEDNCITKLKRSPPFKDYAGVIRHAGVEKICPFTQVISTSECWEMIEDMTKLSPTYTSVGYHIDDIAKGEVGEPSKIVEEALELADAHRQDAKIMSLVEMSDLYGAIDLYRQKYHPSTTFDDIIRMSEITQRAFISGHRK